MLSLFRFRVVYFRKPTAMNGRKGQKKQRAHVPTHIDTYSIYSDIQCICISYILYVYIYIYVYEYVCIYTYLSVRLCTTVLVCMHALLSD